MEDLLKQVGECNRFQFIMPPLAAVCFALSAWSMLLMMFGAIEPDWWCVSQGPFSNSSIGVPTTGVDLNGSRGLQDNSTYKRCEAGQDPNIRCEGIVFSSGIRTVVSEFHLVCGMAWVTPLTISLQMVGVLVGSSVAGQLADNIGRKMTIIGVVALNSITNLITAFSVSWQMFAVMRTLIGTTVGGILAVAKIYPTEFMGVKYRAIIGTIPIWGIGSFTFSLVVWALPNWYHIHIVTAVCSAASLLPWICLPESFRYLSVSGKVAKAERVMRKVARWNGRQAPSFQAIQSLHADTRDSTKKYHILHLFSSWEMGKASVLNAFIWFCSALSYYGISFGMKNFSGNFYHNFMVMTALELPSSLLVYHLCHWLGRRYTIAGSYAIASLGFFVAIPIKLLLSEEESGVIITGLCMLSRMTLTLGWSAETVFVTELMPTVVRNTGMGFCSTTARFGGILAPYLLASDNLYVFYVIIGVAMAAGSAAPLFLPETRGQPLVDELPVSPKEKKMTEGPTNCNESELQGI